MTKKENEKSAGDSVQNITPLKSKTSNQVVVIGLDGAAFELVEAWAKEGHLPSLSKIMDEGCAGVLNTIVPPFTAPAWVSYLTGKHPGNHGIFYFLNKQTDGYQLELFNRNKIVGETIDAILSKNNRSVGLLNVPCTYPPPKTVNGFAISGLGTPSEDSDFTYPDDLKAKIKERFDYQIEPEIRYRKGIEDEYIDTVGKIDEKRYETMKYLMESEEYDFFSVVFRGTDLMGHFFWRFMDKNHPSHDPDMASRYGTVILDYYKKMDRIVGEIYDRIKDRGTLIIMSDHGMGPQHKAVHLDKVLSEWGFLKAKGGFSSWLKKLFSIAGISPDKIHAFLVKAGLRDIIRKFVDQKKTWETVKNVLPAEIDWKRTKAFPLMGTGLIYINVQGRDPEGIVAPGDEYNQLVEKIKNKLLDLRDPDSGAKIVHAVKSGEDVYPGHRLPVPDLSIEWENDLYQNTGMLGYNNQMFSKPLVDRSGNHNPRGIFLAAGKHIAANKEKMNAQIIDLAPTILHVLGVPIPEDMDGQVLLDIFEPGSAPAHIPVFEKADSYNDMDDTEFTAEEKEIIEKQLKRLGYL